MPACDASSTGRLSARLSSGARTIPLTPWLVKPSTTCICCSRSSSRIGAFPDHLDRSARGSELRRGLLGAELHALPVFVRRPLGDDTDGERRCPARTAAAARRSSPGAGTASTAATCRRARERDPHHHHACGEPAPDVPALHRHPPGARSSAQRTIMPHGRHAAERRSLPQSLRPAPRAGRLRGVRLDDPVVPDDDRPGGDPGRPVLSALLEDPGLGWRPRLAGGVRDGAGGAGRRRRAADPRAGTGRERSRPPLAERRPQGRRARQPPEPAAGAAREAAVLRVHRAVSHSDSRPARPSSRATWGASRWPRCRPEPRARPPRSSTSSCCSTRSSSCCWTGPPSCGG